MNDRFRDREEAGAKLADRVAELRLADPVVLALPRGGLPVAVPVAKKLGAPLDLILVRKIGTPGHEELAMGAVVDGPEPHVVWNDEVLSMARVDEGQKKAALERKVAEIAERRTRYLAGRDPVPVEGRDAVVVDDGIATGASVRAALKALRARNPASITLAVPVAPPDTVASLRTDVDHLVCLSEPEHFFAVGAHYADFRQTTDEEVAEALAAS